MPEAYKVTAVKPEPKQWSGAYGPMLTYEVMLEGHEVPVEVNKKPESPAPQKGDELYGDINRTEYGDKFKGAPKPFGGAGGGGGFKGGGKPMADPFTMYLSYAKDIAVALIAAGGKPSTKAFDTEYAAALDTVSAGGVQLYADRNEDAEDKPASEPKPESAAKEQDEEISLEEIDRVLGKRDEEEEPWPPKT